MPCVAAKDSVTFPACAIDVVFVSRRGWCLIIGWLDDQQSPLNDLVLVSSDRVVAVARNPARCRREDAEAAIPTNPGKLLGFWIVFRIEGNLGPNNEVSLCMSTEREQKTFQVQPKLVGDEQLREIALEYFASAGYFANPHAESVLQLDRGLGTMLVNYNVLISSDIIAGAYVTRFGAVAGKLDGSIVVCLYGKAEFLFLQAAAFSDCPGTERYEFIYVSNSPELAERLMKEAAMANRIYDVAITLVILPSNAGFGAANNVAAAHARSDRIMIVNPDIFPRGRDWAVRHHDAVTQLPRDQTAIFGSPLYYDDGSLMHGGMFFEIDHGISIREGRIEQHDIIRVEHYAKGAPAETRAFLTSRQVPAVNRRLHLVGALLVRETWRIFTGICVRPLRGRRSLPEELVEGQAGLGSILFRSGIWKEKDRPGVMFMKAARPLIAGISPISGKTSLPMIFAGVRRSV